MDTLDRKILAELQVQGRLSTTDLASRVGLTVAPTHRRVRDLEASGAIVGYRAVIDPRALGLNFEALVFVTMKQEDRATLLGFEEAAAAVPNILQAYRLFGDPDFLLRVRTTDLEAYTRLQDDVLATLPGVQRFTSTLVMKDVVGDRPYPTH
ncbi:AsnC family transcriptional regulator [Mycolicibacterium insubricum]|jgi:DNA-binding Lrp family transcriptional regulator|uniref:AsnC family transcriptional regulator n=1 Tax=Mycolicibacterium insubricum TaxID=444597 RepID=A0A1X0DLN8_9MYCO|nr:Lrp/AsnC family transcriptional regulator [Mycolicibacterium insubricum]MCB9441998.1 Lrp/AsnC family transcriptional regulator [Mycolicibacterium sp.]MCV7083580.1 Lrp/AsnC family transcriptional regulator [Mycolicibacterium insubricum]ORA73072.1 AsnC family transcriptional regulator [Mycolicibacterium insubricum]BBZ68475.1 AsnC family transcriptional regulator [Mycolicibacterium insubricum]